MTTNDRGIELTDVSHDYLAETGEVVHALAPTTASVPTGQFVSLVGPSGCGKTTLLRILAGFIEPTTGTVTVGGRAVDGPAAQRGVVFQQSTLFPWFTVRDNVELGLRYRGVPAAERHRIAQEHLDLVGLSDVGAMRPYELSGGMQQRAQIARVLANSPEVILMDEPFGALDSLTRKRLQQDLRVIQRERANTVVFITHSVEEAVFLSDRVLVMSPRPGQIVADVMIDLPAREERGDDIRSDADFLAIRDRIAHVVETR